MQKLKGLTVVGKIQLQPTNTATTVNSDKGLEKLLYKTSKRCFVDKKKIEEEMNKFSCSISQEASNEDILKKLTNFLVTYPVNRVNQKAAFLAKQQVQKDAAANVRKYGAAFKR